MAEIVDFKSSRRALRPACRFGHMSSPVRRLHLTEWTEEFDLAADPQFVLKLLDNANIAPTKMHFAVGRNKSQDLIWKRRTVFKKDTVHGRLGEFPKFDCCVLFKPAQGSGLGWDNDAEFSWTSYDHLIGRKSPRMYRKRDLAIANRPCKLSISRLVDCVKLLGSQIAPVYGFSSVFDGSTVASMYQGGFSTTGMTSDETRRAHEIGHNGKKHLAGLLHDVYELNVLSPAHLQNKIGKLTLAAWIEEGDRGSLVCINPKLFAWSVPATIRQPIRERLHRAGLLTTKFPYSESNRL
jgi:hypothetical protein